MGPGWGFLVVLGCGASCFGRGVFRHESGGGRVGDCGQAPCWALLLPGLWRQGLEVVEDVRGRQRLRGWLGAWLGLRLEFGSGMRRRCGGGSGVLLGGVLGWWLGGELAGPGFGWAVGAGFAGVRCFPVMPVAGFGAAGALAVAGAPAAGTGFGACVDRVACGLAGGVPADGVVVEVDEVVVVVVVMESEA